MLGLGLSLANKAAFSTGNWDVSGASYDTKSLSVAAQDGNPRELAFSQDGSKMYMLGSDNDSVFQYTLSTPWDVSTGSYASKSLSVAGQETSPYGMTIKPDGTKVYVGGSNTETIYQYTLSTPWDVSTGTYDNKSFSVITQSTSCQDIHINPIGDTLFVLDFATNAIYQYTLSTPWDISTASYASKSYSVTEEGGCQAMAVKNDGKTVLVVGSTNNTVYQYSLSTAWDISTASYTSKSFSVSSQETTTRGLEVSANNKKMYVTGSANDTVYQYSL